MGKDWKREREKERRKARTTQYIYLMAIHLDDSNGNNRKSFENSTSLCIFFMCFWYTLSVRKTAHHGSCFSFRDFSQMIERMPGTKTVNISTKHGSMEFSYYQITEIVSVFFFSLSLYFSLLLIRTTPPPFTVLIRHFAKNFNLTEICLFAFRLICCHCFPYIYTICVFFLLSVVPSDPPSHMEALLLNSSAVYLKWKAPALQAHNGKLSSKCIIPK